MLHPEFCQNLAITIEKHPRYSWDCVVATDTRKFHCKYVAVLFSTNNCVEDEKRFVQPSMKGEKAAVLRQHVDSICKYLDPSSEFEPTLRVQLVPMDKRFVINDVDPVEDKEILRIYSENEIY